MGLFIKYAIRFWLNRGVDGFRLDVAHYIMKDPGLRDNPANPHPENVVFKAMRRVIDSLESVLPAGAWPNYVLGNHDEPRLCTRNDGLVVAGKEGLIIEMD